MAYSTIKKPSDYFNTKLYTGDGTTSNSITGVGFQPDWIWIKKKNSIASHRLLDSIRGVQKHLASDNTDAEVTQNSVMSFDADGFTVGDSAGTNGSSDTFASWNWLGANGTSANTDGTISSTVSANTTSGFSVVSYTGTGANATVGHGLGTAPQVIIWKNRDATGSWLVWHHSLPLSSSEYQVGFLNLTNSFAPLGTYNLMNATAPTSSVFTTDAVPEGNGSGNNIIAYCFAEKKGFSKFGSYTGNGSADGPFIYTGFKPAFVIIKVSSTTNDWSMYDNQRDPINQVDNYLQPNTSNAEVSDTGKGTDFLSNGFKLRTTHGTHNTSGANYIYMAFAEEPLVGDNPATAR